MGVAREQDFTSTAWREALSRYADLIVRTFASDLSALSGTGLPLPLDRRSSLAVSQEDDNLENIYVSAFGKAAGLTLSEEEIVGDWYNEGSCRPLLISGPFGSGKSVLLAELASGMAEGVKYWCDEPTGEMPPVPLPVRLRAWTGEITLEQYVETDALRHVLSAGRRDWLNADQIHALNRAGKLVPLLDGLDELPETAKRHGVTVRPRVEALADIWRLFPEHHVLTSRTGHGIEGGRYGGNILAIGDLTPGQAEYAACRILGVPETDSKHPFHLHFKADNQRLNRLLCRPLFMAAWCNLVTRRARSANDATLAELMNTVLEHLLDHRIADHQQADADDLRATLLRERHLLGAVLALHAVKGFGVVVDHDATAMADAHASGLSLDTVRKYTRYAVRAGLLLPSWGGTFVLKIPVTEYLIGHYYAWLPTRELIGCRALADHFSRQCWLVEFESVWRHCFDELWRGDSIQIDSAKNLTDWMLNLCQACADTATWNGDHHHRGEDADRLPPGYDRFVLSLLLPTPDHAHPDARSALKTQIERAIGLWQVRQAMMWQHLRTCDLLGEENEKADFDALLRRHPRRIINWVLNCLEQPNYAELYAELVSALTRSWSLVEDDQLDRLLPIATKSEYERAWGAVAPDIRRIELSSRSLDRDAIQRMLNFGSDGYSDTWRDYEARRIAKLPTKSVNEEAASLLAEFDTLQSFTLTHNDLMRLSASLYDLAPRLNRSDAERLFHALRLQRDEEVKANLAMGVSRTCLRPSTDDLQVLLGSFDDPRYGLARGGLALSIANADQPLTVEVARRLTQLLQHEKDRPHWNRICDALARAWFEADAEVFVRERLTEAVKVGCIAYARRLQAGVPGLIVFVRDADRSMEWCAACAGEPALTLPLRLAPPPIKLLMSSGTTPVSPQKQQKDVWLLTAAVIRLIAAGVAAHLPDKLAAFEARWLLPAGEKGQRDKGTSTRNRRLREVLRLICSTLPQARHGDFCCRGPMRGMDALRPPGTSDGSQGKRLEVHAALLTESLHGSQGAELAHRIYKLVAGQNPSQPDSPELADPVFSCPRCGRLFPVPDLDGASLRELPTKCDICGGRLRFVAKDAAEMPPAADARQCASHDDLWFRVVSVSGQEWPFSIRMALPDVCPCPKCQQIKRPWRAAPKPKRLH